MMLDAVTFDLGSTSMPKFSLPDTSGLAPLVLPMEFLHRQQHLQADPSVDAVNRFGAAMSVEPRLSKSAVVNLIERTIPDVSIETTAAASDVPVTADKQDDVSFEVPVSTVAGTPTVLQAESLEAGSLEVENREARSRKPVAVEASLVPQAVWPAPETGAGYTASIPIEKTTIAVERHVTTVVNPVAVETPVAIDKPVVVVEKPVVAVDKPVDSVDKPVVAVDKPVAAVDKPVAAVDKPVRESIEPVAKPGHSGRVTLPNSQNMANVVLDGRNVVLDGRGERPARPQPQVLATGSIEKPEASVIAPAVMAHLVSPVGKTEPSVEGQKTESREFVAVEVPSMPQAVRPAPETGAGYTASIPIEKTTIAAEKPVTTVVNPVAVETPVAIDKPVVVAQPVVVDKSVDYVEKPVIAVDKPVVVAEKIVVAVDKPVVAVDTPVVVVEKSVVVEGQVAADKLVRESIEPVAKPGHAGRVILPNSPDMANVVLDGGSERPARPQPQALATSSIEKPDASAITPTVMAHLVSPVGKTEPSVESQKTESRGSVAVEVPSMPQAVQDASEVVVATTSIDKTATAVENPVSALETPVAIDKPAAVVGKPVAVDGPVVVDKPAAVVGKPVAVDGPVVVDKTVAIVGKPAVAEEPVAVDKSADVFIGKKEQPIGMVGLKPESRESENPKSESREAENRKVDAAAHVVVAPIAVDLPSVPQAVQAMPEVAAVSAASARTEAIVETVNQIVEAVVGQILVTPGIEHGECEIKITLKPTVLDGSEITMSAKDGTLAVSIVPTTQAASAAAAAALPRLETALAEHVSAFHHVSVALALKKGSRNETV